MSNALPFRKDVPDNQKWDVTDIFTSDEAFYATVDETLQKAKKFREQFENQLSNPKVIENALDDYSQILIQVDRMANYAELRLSVDTSDEAAQTVSSKFNTTFGKIISQLAFVESEILQ